MGIINRTFQKIFGRAPNRNPDEEPFTFTFITNKNGETGSKALPVGSYNIRVNMKDKRLVNILGINNHKTSDNIVVQQGDNGVFKIIVKHPTFGYIVQPNGRLNVNEVKTGIVLPEGAIKKFFARIRNHIARRHSDIKLRIFIVLPQKCPVTRYKSFWNYLFFQSKPPLPYSDFEVYLEPVDPEKGTIIKIQPGKVSYPPGRLLAEVVPKLRIVDGRRTLRTALWGPDTVDLRTVLDWGRISFSFNRLKGYLISAMFTNEDFRDVQPIKYNIMVKLSFGKVVDQHLQIGTIEFTEGEEENINLTIERVHPTGRGAIPADGVSKAEFRIKAEYKDNQKLKPHGLPVTIITSRGPLYSIDEKELPEIGGKGTNTYQLTVNSGLTDHFIIKSTDKIEDVVISAKMLSSNEDTYIQKIGGFDLRLIRTEKTESEAGSTGRVQVRVQAIDRTTNRPINNSVYKHFITFRVETGLASLAQPGTRPGGASGEIKIPVGKDGIAIVDVIPGPNADIATIIATMDEYVTEPLTIPIKFKPVKLEWEKAEVRIPATMNENEGTQYTLRVTKEDGTGGVVGVPVRISIEDFPENITESGKTYPRLEPPTGAKAERGSTPQSILLKSDEKGEIVFRLIPGRNKGNLRLVAAALTGEKIEKNITIIGVGLNLIHGSEDKEEKTTTLLADGSTVTAFTIITKGADGNNISNYKVSVSLSGEAAGRGTGGGEKREYAVITTDPTGKNPVKDMPYEITTQNNGVAHFYVRTGVTAGDLKVTATTNNETHTIKLKLVHPKVKIINNFNEHERDEWKRHVNSSEPTGFEFDKDAYYGFLQGRRYLLVAQVATEDNTNVVADGTIVKFIAQREKSIGRFFQHGSFKIVEEKEPNEVHVKTQGGIAKVEYQVTNNNKDDHFVVIYAKLKYSSEQDQILVPIIHLEGEEPPEDDDPEKTIPGYGDPNLTMEFVGN